MVFGLQASIQGVQAGLQLAEGDVGVTDPSNLALGDLHLSQQVVAAGGSVPCWDRFAPPPPRSPPPPPQLLMHGPRSYRSA